MAICKGCQGPLVFVTGRKGKKIPLEPTWLDVVPAISGERSVSVMLADGTVRARMRLRQPGDPFIARGRILHHAT